MLSNRKYPVELSLLHLCSRQTHPEQETVDVHICFVITYNTVFVTPKVIRKVDQKVAHVAFVFSPLKLFILAGGS